MSRIMNLWVRNRSKIAWGLYFLNVAIFLVFSLATIFQIETAESKAVQWGLGEAMIPVGIAELVATLLYMHPRTAAFGVLYLTAHVGACMAVRVLNDMPLFFPAAVLGILWMSAWMRNPEFFAGFAKSQSLRKASVAI